MREAQTLSVNLYGEAIGTLTLIPGDQSFFAFNDGYLDDPDRPTLSLSFKDQFGGILRQTRTTQTSLSPFFSNMLPEGHMRTYLAERAGVKAVREFHLIWALGKDLPGAVTVTAPGDTAWIDEGEGGAEQAADDIKDRALRFSLAGVQMKFSAIHESDGGLTIPVKGQGGDWIVKLPSPKFPRVPENELSMMTLAGMVGMDVPEYKLVDPAEVADLPPDVDTLNEPAFAIRRFDRTPAGDRIHVEDFAQVFRVYPGKKYKKASFRMIAKIVRIETGLPGVQEFIRRLVFNTLIGNADMHLKNWSLIYEDRRVPSLAPAYDFVSTIHHVPTEDFALKYARTKKMAELSLDELAYLSAKAGLPETMVRQVARQTVERFVEVWRKERMNLPLSTEIRNAIDRHYPTIALYEETKR